MTHYTKKRIETVSNSFRRNALSVAISALSTTLAGVRDGLKGGVYVTLIAGQVVAPVAWAANLPELAAGASPVTIDSSASIDGIEAGNSAVYNVTGDRALANWISFDIAEGYGIEFLQSDPSNILVNQITGSASEIAGLLKANGNIILVNPNGMTIAGTAIIDVNSLVVSGMGLSGGVDAGTQDFFQGNDEAENYNNLLFLKTDANGKITIESGVDFINDAEGVAHTRNNNFIAIGAEVNNAANITVGNLLGLGAGGAGYISFNQGGLVGFEITADVTDAVGTNAISSTGELSAQQVFLTARDASDLYNSAINLEGTAKAASINIDGDTIRLGGSVDLSNGTDTLNIHNNSAATELTIGNSASIDFGTDGQAMAVASKVTIENGNTTLNNAQLTGADNEITLGTTDFSVTSVNDINLGGGSIEGSAGADTFDVTDANALTSAGIDFTGVNTVNAGT
ncbi:two-partner secretion domain-containing protein, partial [Thalassolituus maritimus]|uniref:two-partner secretion domain-containing protein n=3 Tax=Thalassolituus TaxID=187492 RepID=UPI0026EDA8A1